MSYEMILRKGEELLYCGSSLKGYVEELETENFKEEEGGFSSRKIMVSILHPAKDKDKNQVEIERNTSISRAGKSYIIDELSIETGLYSKYYELTCYEEIKETSPKGEKLLTIEDKLELMALKVLGAQVPYSFVSKLEKRTQEEYEALSYPRVMFDFWLGPNLERVTRSKPVKCEDGKFYEIETYDREVNFTFEFYASADTRASITDFEDFISNSRKLASEIKEFFENDEDIIVVAPLSYTAKPNNASKFRNNQPRRRKPIYLTLGVNYIKKTEVTDFIENLSIKKESEVCSTR